MDATWHSNGCLVFCDGIIMDAGSSSQAACIVRAVNNFDDLIGCVKAALNMVDGDGFPPNWDLLRATLKAAGAS